MLKNPRAFPLLSLCGKLLLAQFLITPPTRVYDVGSLTECKHRQPIVLCYDDIARTAAVDQRNVHGVPSRVHMPYLAVIREQDMLRIAEERDRHHIHPRRILDLLTYRAGIRVHIDPHQCHLLFPLYSKGDIRATGARRQCPYFTSLSLP